MRHSIIVAVAAIGLAATTVVANANGAEKCFDKGTLAYGDCGPADWSGWYLGAHAGYAWADFEDDQGIFTLEFEDLEMNGFLAGGQIGFQRQYDSGLLLGLELDFSGVWADDAVNFPGAGLLAPHGLDAELDWLASARVRVGLPQGEWMPYLTGGVALAGYEASGFFLNAGNKATIDEVAFGGVVGGGVELKLDQNWIAGLEGLYYFFDESETISGIGFGIDNDVTFNDVAVARARLSYKF